MSALHLYELTANLKQFEQLADSGDIPADVIRDTLEAMTGDLQDKAINIAKFVQSLEASADAMDSAAKAMQHRANRVRKRADSIKAYLLYNLLESNTSRIEAPEFVISIRDNPEQVIINDDAQIPPEFMRTPEPPDPAPDKKAIKDALKAGVEIRGVWLQRSQRLDIKT